MHVVVLDIVRIHLNIFIVENCIVVLIYQLYKPLIICMGYLILVRLYTCPALGLHSCYSYRRITTIIMY